MISPGKERSQEIESGLEKFGTKVKRESEGRWNFNLCNGKSLHVHARLENEWLLLDAPVQVHSNDGQERNRRMLLWNGDLAGLSKYAMLPADPDVRIRAEIPLAQEIQETSIGNILGETCEGFRQAADHIASIGGSNRTGQSPVEVVSAGTESLPTFDFGPVLNETGWAYTPRSPGRTSVDLECGREFFQALLEARPDGSIRASAELVRWQDPAKESCDALALLLLSASAIVRMVRPVADTAPDHIAAGFEVQFAAPPSAAWLDRTLAALSVACGLCGREAAILNDRAIARQYLALHGYNEAA